MHKFILPAAALSLVAATASAQGIVDVSVLTSLEDIEINTVGGDEIGEIETALIGPDGSLVALVVEVGGFLGIGEEERVLPIERLVFENGEYTTDLTVEDVEAMPTWDD
jgi:hypothetical protein